MTKLVVEYGYDVITSLHHFNCATSVARFISIPQPGLAKTCKKDRDRDGDQESDVNACGFHAGSLENCFVLRQHQHTLVQAVRRARVSMLSCHLINDAMWPIQLALNSFSLLADVPFVFNFLDVFRSQGNFAGGVSHFNFHFSNLLSRRFCLFR